MGRNLPTLTPVYSIPNRYHDTCHPMAPIGVKGRPMALDHEIEQEKSVKANGCNEGKVKRPLHDPEPAFKHEAEIIKSFEKESLSNCDSVKSTAV